MLLRIVDRFEEILIASLMEVVTVLIFVAVVHRHASGVPFLRSETVSRCGVLR